MIDTCDDSRPILKRNLPGNWRHTNALKLRQGWYIAMQKSRAPSEQEILINILSETIIIMPLFEVPVLYFDKLKHQIWFKPLKVLQPSLHSSYKLLLYWSWFSTRCLNHSIIIINADSFSIPTTFFIQFCLYLANFTKAYKSFSPVRVISHVKGYMYHNSPKIEVPVPEFIQETANLRKITEWLKKILLMRRFLINRSTIFSGTIHKNQCLHKKFVWTMN